MQVGLLGKMLRKLQGLKKVGLGRRKLKCQTVEKEGSDNPTGHFGPGVTPRMLSQFEADRPGPYTAA